LATFIIVSPSAVVVNTSGFLLIICSPLPRHSISSVHVISRVFPACSGAGIGRCVVITPGSSSLSNVRGFGRCETIMRQPWQ
jgi:hypothetical protein